MPPGDDPALTVDEFVEYCRTQAGLLAGQAETTSEEAAALLDEVDDDAAAIRARLDDPDPENAGGESGPDPATVAELESALETKQAAAADRRERAETLRELAAGYLDLAADLRAAGDDAREALDRVVRFEVDRDAATYSERQTVAEALASGDDAADTA